MRRLGAVAAGVAAGLLLGTGTVVADSAAYLFARAKLLADQGAREEALESFEAAVAREPEAPYLRLEYARFLGAMGRAEEAAAQIEKAGRLDPDNIEILRTQGQLHLQLAHRDPRALEKARAALEEIRERRGGDVESLAMLGRLYLGESRWEEAAEVFREVLRYRPRNRLAHSALIETLMRSGRAEEAERAMEEFLEVDPRASQTRIGLADLRAQRGDHAGAVELLLAAPASELERGEVRRRLAFELYRMGDLQGALEWVDRALEESDDFGAAHLKSLVLSALGRDEESAALLRELAEQEPENTGVALLLARQSLTAGHPRESIEVLEPLLEEAMDSGDGEMVLVYAEALRRVERADEALDWLARIASREEWSTAALSIQAEILFEEGRSGEARQLLEELASGAEVDGLVAVARVYQVAELYSDSIPFLETALEQEPESVQILFWLGAAYERTERPAVAEERFRLLLDLDPDFAPALNYLGYMWADRGENLEEALGLLTRAVKLQPDNGAYVDSLGWVYFHLGELEEARVHLERAAELVGDDAVVFEHLGDLYLELGDEVAAREVYEHALTMQGENAAAVERKLAELGEAD